jgi:hypothetical protein
VVPLRQQVRRQQQQQQHSSSSGSSSGSSNGSSNGSSTAAAMAAATAKCLPSQFRPSSGWKCNTDGVLATVLQLLHVSVCDSSAKQQLARMCTHAESGMPDMLSEGLTSLLCLSALQ